MKLPKILHPKHTIAKRLTWRVVGTTTVVMLLISVLVFGIFWIMISTGFSLYYQKSSKIYNERINNIFSQVEVAISNNMPEAEHNMSEGTNHFQAVETLLALNPTIMGSALAYNPDYEPKRGVAFAPYAWRDSTGIHTKQLNTEDYDYLHQPWYTQPVEEGKSTWSEPYIDKGGGEVMMITYSQPMLNNRGEIYAILTADLALDWLSELMREMDVTNRKDFLLDDESEFYSFIVTHQGNIVAHPDKRLLMEKTLADILRQSGDSSNAENRAKTILSQDNGLTFAGEGLNNAIMLYYTQIERTGWMVVNVLPLDNILEPANYIAISFFVLMFVGLVFISFVCWRSIRRVTRPISQFADSADEIASGNFAAELPRIRTKDEMLRLHDSFETMQKSLIKQIEETKLANEAKGRIESELSIAHDIQKAMLPKTFPPYPERDDVDIYGQQQPAKEVGGDLYSFYIRDEKLFFSIGDVSGKGVPASLVMAVTQTLFRTISRRESQPDRIMTAINNALNDHNESSMFVTLFIGVLDLPTGRLRYCNGAHNAPVIIGKEPKLLPCTSNVPLGIERDWKFDLQETVLTPGTCIFLYTDGLTEAENACHDQFMEERMIATASEAMRQPQPLIKQMTDAVHQFVGDAEQSDDMTMLAIQYTKPQEKNMKLQRSITLNNNIDEVPQLATFVDEVCEAVGLDMSTTMSINLALEEAVVNVMTYAYPQETTGNVDIEAMANDERLKFTISDWGTPFDPTAQKEVDTTLSAEERPIGGLGIHLVRHIMDSINYERTDGKNVLTLRKKLI